MKPRPNLGVMEWLETADEDRLFLSVATLGELRYGIERLAKGQRRAQLEEWLETELVDRFEGRVLIINDTVAATWGKVLAKADATGKPMGTMDGFIAATALMHGMSIVTRNEIDFAEAGVATFNPWGN